MKNFLWFSRHPMTVPQREDLERILGNVDVTQINGLPKNIHEYFEAVPIQGTIEYPCHQPTGAQPPLKELVTQFDEVGLVLPVDLQSQILPFCPNGRFLSSRNKRVFDEDGKVNFCFDGWVETVEIKIVTNNL